MKPLPCFDNPHTKELFVDSGAYSAWTRGVDIDIDAYIEFLLANKKHITHYANLDVIDHRDPIRAAEQSLKNLAYMRSKGLKPIPCFHHGEPFHYLDHMVGESDFIALGGAAHLATNDRARWMDECFHKHICDKAGIPRTRVHGFGMTNFRLFVRYPWYSVDSTRWLLQAAYGCVFIPYKVAGEFVHNADCEKICLSDRCFEEAEDADGLGLVRRTKQSVKQVQRYHFRTRTKLRRQDIIEYIEQVCGESVPVSESCTADGTAARERINIIFMQRLCDAQPKWPWVFTLHTRKSGFDL